MVLDGGFLTVAGGACFCLQIFESGSYHIAHVDPNLQFSCLSLPCSWAHRLVTDVLTLFFHCPYTSPSVLTLTVNMALGLRFLYSALTMQLLYYCYLEFFCPKFNTGWHPSLSPFYYLDFHLGDAAPSIAPASLRRPRSRA